MSKMMNVPENTITGKDLDYLSDIFEWNLIAFKKTCNDLENVTDKEIKDILSEASDLFDDNLDTVLSIISNPGGDIDE